MSNDADRPPISRPLKVEEIRDGAGGQIDATQSEMADIAGMLDLVGLAGFAFTYRLHRGGAGRLRLTGRLKAAVTQTCVVSLDPVETSIDVPVEVEFWPVSMIEELEQAADEPGGSGLRDWPEPIAGGKIDLGPAIYETLATALDLYPKWEGVSFDWSQGASDGGGPGGTGPFAALAELKRR
jgi:Large ribosomal RNA subunit accumulation protein YceD